MFAKQDYTEPPLNIEVLDCIGQGKKILDAGCGPGKLGLALRKKGCHVVGIESDAALARIAAENYDDLIVADLEEMRTLEYPRGYFDVIVFADVLEHLKSPHETLLMLRDYLADDGYIIACIPNAANWQVRLPLFFGRFEYKPGITDGGHLRFFTRKSAIKLICSAGFDITWVKSRNRVLRILGRCMPGLFAFQFVIKAHKRK